jgi:hypothetical protein
MMLALSLVPVANLYCSVNEAFGLYGGPWKSECDQSGYLQH